MRREVLVWVALLASSGGYATACVLPALGPPLTEGGPDMVKAMNGAECFAMGLLYFIFGVPLLLAWAARLPYTVSSGLKPSAT